ncbi:MAG: type II toxin-antitoxin system VapC family toxin [Actinobacteria bacterium]|nr:type II toxin-antitoxin system VapC family toxin [Actinomycetota bacterium]
MRSVIAHPTIITIDTPVLLRALAIYEHERVAFADAYLAAQAQGTGVDGVLSSDRALDRVPGITRREP